MSVLNFPKRKRFRSADVVDMFASNGLAFFLALVTGLFEMQRIGEIKFTPEVLSEYLQDTEKFVALATSVELSERTAAVMQEYLRSMGWKPNLPRAQWGDFDRQHSYAANYFVPFHIKQKE